nr:response regulator [uncultured Noviherbaspirillum sp.]
MAPDLAADCFSRPHVLIADDSRIVRATLSKHLSDLFEFSEALDGEEAWAYLLRHESVDLLITDLTMPRLDGYGLLRRMRGSRSEHLREMPVVVVSGTDDADERRQAIEAGATDLITKGMPTAQLLSRMTLLAQLVGAQRRHVAMEGDVSALSPYAFQSGAARLFAQALRRQESFALLNLAVSGDAGPAERLLAGLKPAIRQTDLLACTGASEFTVASTGLDTAAARSFAGRLCDAARAVQTGEGGESGAAVICCGVATIADGAASPAGAPALHELWDAARRRRRSQAGQARAFQGAVGPMEESAFPTE